MKKAIAYVDKAELFLALKIPFGLDVIAMEYPSKNGKMKLTLQGDRLPVDDVTTKKLQPEVSYEMHGTWHQARVEAIEIEESEPVIKVKVAPDKIDLMKSPFDEGTKDKGIKDKEPKEDEILIPDSGQDVEIKPKEDVNHGKKRRNTKKSKRNTGI